MAKLKEIFSLKNPTTRRVLHNVGIIIVGFIVLGVIAVQVWEYSNSTHFCSYACHGVHPEEPAAYQDFYHARVKCTECHMGRVSPLQGLVLKASHYQHLPQVLFDSYERPLESTTMRPANESCERCHWPPAFHSDRVLEIKHFQSDRDNTEERIYLILKTGGGERARGLGYGIHWHIENPVEYIATDEHKQDIPWVRTTLPDGRVVEFNDVTNPLSAEEIARAEKRVMDCVDCHNRMGHPFPHPEPVIDTALAEGRLSRNLPFAKEWMLTLLTADYPNREVALAAVEEMETQYKATYPEVAVTYAAEIEQAAELARELLTQLVFKEPGITWRSFPDHGGHKEFPGCFRCHDGKHLSAEGESIRLHCNICHAIPVKVAPGDRPPEMPAASIQEPPSHLETNFMADHRFQANSHCEACHGEIAFGSDDSSFCANSACHGQAWPMVDLDAAFPHPIPLEGKHAEVWCHNCHNGVRKPSYQCDNCHQPAMQPHFGEVCEDCHTPAGFELADLTGFEHPAPLEGAHADLDCSACHTAGESLTYQCANCHQPPKEPHFGKVCEDCHTPTGFKGATIPLELHPVPLIGSHQRATCDVCHAEGKRIPEYVCSDCHRPPEDHPEMTCDTCHTPEGWVKSATSVMAQLPQIPHSLKGMDNCLQCHAMDSKVKPAPASHEEYTNEQCLTCHTSAEGEEEEEAETPVVTQLPQIPHSLKGMDNCLQCHAVDSAIKPAPASHEEYTNEQCPTCHAPETQE